MGASPSRSGESVAALQAMPCEAHESTPAAAVDHPEPRPEPKAAIQRSPINLGRYVVIEEAARTPGDEARRGGMAMVMRAYRRALLARSNQQRPRALELARRARSDYASAHARKELQEVERWLARRAR